MVMYSKYVVVSRHPGVCEFIAYCLGGTYHPRREGYFPSIQIPDEKGGHHIIHVIDGDATSDDVRDKYVIGNVPLRLACLAREVIAIEFVGKPPRGQEYTKQDMINEGAYLMNYVVRCRPTLATRCVYD